MAKNKARRNRPQNQTKPKTGTEAQIQDDKTKESRDLQAQGSDAENQTELQDIKAQGSGSGAAAEGQDTNPGTAALDAAGTQAQPAPGAAAVSQSGEAGTQTELQISGTDKQTGAHGAAAEKQSGAEKTAEEGKSSENDTKKSVQESKSSKKKEVLYRVESKRDSGVIKAYITFTYRVFHPGVSARLFIYGLLILLPGVFFFKDLFWKIFFIGIGVAVILLAFFRQYISLWITKKNDPDYKSGAVFRYDFRETDAEFFKNDERFSRLAKYKDITNFYYDDDYYYLAIMGRDFFVIPKKAFTIGDASEFEEFIYRKSKHTCRWIPDKLGDKLKKRRAERTIAAERMAKK